MTNRCTNCCDFCIRGGHSGMGNAETLWLEREPTREEILSDVFSYDLNSFGEIVFCGFGEPFERGDDLLWIAARIKEKADTPIRVNTNGHGNLIADRNICPQMANIIDTVSISLNYASAEKYVLHCKPEFGSNAYSGMLDFAAEAKKYVPHVILSVVDVIGNDEIEKCRAVAADVGVAFRVRKFE